MEFSKQVIDILSAAPTYFHFIKLVKSRLLSCGYVEKTEFESFENIPSKFFVVRDNQSLVAVNLATKDAGVIVGSNYEWNGIWCNAKMWDDNVYEKIVTEMHGNNEICTWIDRDLKIAGRVIIRGNDNKYAMKLVDTDYPVSFIPGLSVNLALSKMRSFPNYKKEDFYTFIGFNSDDEKEKGINSNVLMGILAKECNCSINDKIDFEIYFVPYQNPNLIGTDKKLLTSPRISNIGASIASLLAFENVEKIENGMCILSLFNTKTDLLSSLLKKMNVNDTFYQKAIFTSVKCINGHNPNFSDKLKPILGKGPVITNLSPYISPKTLFLKEIQEMKSVKLQFSTSQTVTSDPIQCIITKLGLQSFEIAIPVLGKDSIIETCSIDDLDELTKFIQALFIKCC